jgi:hypothetical protein
LTSPGYKGISENEQSWSSGQSPTALRFGVRESILSCFQNGRTTQWARAHFFVGRNSRPGVEVSAKPKCRSSNRMDLGKIREAAERVARSEGLEVFDVEWKIGKERLLRVYIDRLPGAANPENLGITHKDCERVSEQLNVILDVEDLVPGPSYILEVSCRKTEVFRGPLGRLCRRRRQNRDERSRAVGSVRRDSQGESGYRAVGRNGWRVSCTRQSS